MLRVRPSDMEPAPRLEAIIRYTLDEASAARPGGQCLLTRLVEVLFVEILRRHMEDRAVDEVKPLAALRDPVVRRALESLHAELEKPWTLEELAHRVGVSRSVLAERFKNLMGCPPMLYLTKWRLQVAAHCLAQPQESTASVAARVGYESQAAFNRAFKRYAGVPPGTWRRKLSSVISTAQ
jgi:transcriptional regulator GlxA family with amidase domain